MSVVLVINCNCNCNPSSLRTSDIVESLKMHGSITVSILYVLMFCDIGSDGMDSAVLKSSRVGQFLKRLKELVWNSAF